MPATLATIAELLKEVYQPRIREQLNSDITTLKRITRSGANIVTEGTNGKYVVFTVHTRRNSGIGSRYEDEALPAPGNQKHANARVALKYAYGSVQITGQAIRLSDSDPKAFAKALDSEVNGLKDDLQKDMNRQIYADGTGRIAGVAAAGTGVNTVQVDDGRLFQLGEVVDIVTLSGPTVAVSARIVNSVDLTVSPNTVTLSGATFNVTAPSGGNATQILTRTGSSVGASGNRELTGIGQIVKNTGAVYNIDPATEPLWAAVVNANGGTNRSLSEALMTKVVDDIRVNGGSTSVGFTSLGVRRAYFNLLSQTRQTVNTQEFKGGFSGLAFTTDKGEIPIVVDVDAPLNKIWFLNEDNFTFYRDMEWEFLDLDGSMWKQFRDSSGNPYDKWYANMAEYHELGCERRNSQGVLADITEN
jgi:hypothetical protein